MKEKSILKHPKRILDSHYFDAKVQNRLLEIYPEDRPDPLFKAREREIQTKACRQGPININSDHEIIGPGM